MVQTRTLWNLGWACFNLGDGSAWALAAYHQPTLDNIQRAAEGYLSSALNFITAYATEKDADAGFVTNGTIGIMYSLIHTLLEYLPKGAPAKSISRAMQPVVNIVGVIATYPEGLKDEHKKLKAEYEKLAAQVKGTPATEIPSPETSKESRPAGAPEEKPPAGTHK